MLGLCAPLVKLRGTDLVQIRALSSTGLRPATIYLCKAHTEAQAALASWCKADMEVPQAPASWRRAHTEAQAVAASGHAPRLALPLDKALAVREICLPW
jgi:hypothetical protein